MLTIKGFARLCGCSAQTLRYYDRVALLKPRQVDKWTGYRYYEEAQALDFIRIRNLQAADFSIGEIKALLRKPEGEICAAFDAKIEAQRARLTRIEEIKQAYLHEMQTMDQIVHSAVQYLLGLCRRPSLLREFGVDEKDFDLVMDRLRGWAEGMLRVFEPCSGEITLQVDEAAYVGPDAVAAQLDVLSREGSQDKTVLLDDHGRFAKPAETETVWERHDWAHPREFLAEMPALTDGRTYSFCFHLADEALQEDASFCLLMIGVMLLRQGDFACRGCEGQRSGDGQNHFYLLREK
ncbi:MAG: MerR family transcriptional regulator [Clostridia bacterium]|nr:MerR family transcriptional regulator [Clostridia bacterium]